MNPSLSAIAENEGDASRFMPPCPSAQHDHGNGRTEEVPLVSREFLRKCGTEALYIVLSEMDADERFDAETKEELIDLIISKTHGQRPDKSEQLPPMIPPRPATAREKRFSREMRRHGRASLKEARSHGDN